MNKTIYPNKKTKKDMKHTLYVNVIGKKADEFITGVFRTWPWTSNPKVIKGELGTFKVRKYSLLLDPDDWYMLKDCIITRAKHVENDKVHCLVEDRKNLFIIDRIKY